MFQGNKSPKINIVVDINKFSEFHFFSFFNKLMNQYMHAAPIGLMSTGRY